MVNPPYDIVSMSLFATQAFCQSLSETRDIDTAWNKLTYVTQVSANYLI